MTGNVTGDVTGDVTGTWPALLLEPGTIFARRYRVRRLLGQGGMGSVYEVEDRLLGETVALKLATQTSAEAHDAIRREVSMARRITHPNVARIFDVGVHDGALFLTMEYIAGQHLGVAAPGGRFTLAECVRIGAQLACALGAAHDAGVLHLDLKPHNVLLVSGAPDRVVLLDFGIARACGARGTGHGTWAYGSPEQILDETLTGASDIYSFGILLYRMFTGAFPFPTDQLLARVMKTAPALEVPEAPAFGRLIDAMLARAPAARPTIGEVALALANLALHGDPVQCALAIAPPSGPPDLATLPGDGGERLVRARRRVLHENGPREVAAVCDALLVEVPRLAPALALRALAHARAWTVELDASDATHRADRATAAVADAIASAAHLADTHCADAHVALAAGQVGYAVRAVRRALARDPLHGPAHELLGALELQAGGGSDARLRLADVLEPRRATPLLARATAACFAGRVEEAQALVHEADARGTHPRDTLLWCARRCAWFDAPAAAGALLADPRFADRAHRVARFVLDALVAGAGPERVTPFFEPLLGSDVTPAHKALLYHLQVELLARAHPDVALLLLARSTTLPTVDLAWLDGCPALASLRATSGFLSARALVLERVRLAFVSPLGRLDGDVSDTDATLRRAARAASGADATALLESDSDDATTASSW